MLHVHINFPGSPRNSYVPHTSFGKMKNDENVYTTILHWPSETCLIVEPQVNGTGMLTNTFIFFLFVNFVHKKI